jgi:hypothetical protein
VLDGELAVPDQTGRTVFAAMMKHRQQARFYAFDLLYLNGEDLRNLPLLTRKAKLRRLLPSRSAHVLYVDHTKGSGQRLYELALSVRSRRDCGKEGHESLRPECEGGRLGQDQESSVFTEGRTRGLVQSGQVRCHHAAHRSGEGGGAIAIVSFMHGRPGRA